MAQCRRAYDTEALNVDVLESVVEIKPKASYSSSAHPTFVIKTLHLSCQSDAYDSNAKFAGFILYGFRGRGNWTLNGIHCQSGYVVVKRTDTAEFKKEQADPNNKGVVHGAAYKLVFGEAPGDDVVGEGFSIQNGEILFNSISFNTPSPIYHDN